MTSSIKQSLQRYALVGGVLYLAIVVPACVGELCFALWLTMKGVNVDKWPR